MYGRIALSMSNGDASLSVGDCDSESHLVGTYIASGLGELYVNSVVVRFPIIEAIAGK